MTKMKPPLSSLADILEKHESVNSQLENSAHHMFDVSLSSARNLAR